MQDETKALVERLPPVRHDRDCEYVQSDGPAPCTCSFYEREREAIEALSRPQPDEEAVEQVARAICSANGEDPDYMDTTFPEWRKYMPDARAAIAALSRTGEAEARTRTQACPVCNGPAMFSDTNGNAGPCSIQCSNAQAAEASNGPR